jgi:hypothetical protein
MAVRLEAKGQLRAMGQRCGMSPEHQQTKRPANAALRELLPGLQLPGADDSVFYRICIPAFEVSDDHHVLGEAARHRERFGERLEQEVSEAERRTDDDMAVIELPGDQSPAVPPVKQAAAARLGDAVELSCEAAHVVELHRVMVARTNTRMPSL